MNYRVMINYMFKEVRFYLRGIKMKSSMYLSRMKGNSKAFQFPQKQQYNYNVAISRAEK